MKQQYKDAIRIIAFLLLFTFVLTLTTYFFYPKWTTDQEISQMNGVYREEKNTLDVLYLGSCNMYTSVAPTLIYEEYGITGYADTCPDQAMSTSYFYLKDVLKRQSPKVVVVEALFLTCPDNSRRARYNRFALDYMPLSFNKIALAAVTAKREVEVMRQYDSSVPDTLLTFMSYIFPLLRYHSRNDLSKTDLSFFLTTDLYNYGKGCWPQYNYATNDGLYFDTVFNGSEIQDTAKKWFPKIKELCDKKGIELLVMKSPNYARWGYDDTQTKIARDYVEGLGVPFLDLHQPQYDVFEEYDYGYGTGRMNIYGMKKLSSELGAYLVNTYDLQPTALTEAQKENWDNCVRYFYDRADEHETSIRPGQIAQLKNTEDSIRIRWNPADDCDSYSIYRRTGKSGSYELITEGAAGCVFFDTAVEHGQGYSYYVVPENGALKGRASDPAYYVFVSMPQNVQAQNEDGIVRLSWDEVKNITRYRIQRRLATAFNFEQWDTTTYTTYPNTVVDCGKLYHYRICARIVEDGKTYDSETVIVSQIPQKTPTILSCSSSKGANTIKWEKLPEQGELFVFRRAEDEKEFKLLKKIDGSSTQFADTDVTAGKQYFYKIQSHRYIYNFDAKSAFSNTVGIIAK